MSRPYHSPKRAADKRRTHESILQALVDVVLDEGVHAFTVQRVAEHAGVSQRTVYRHFDDRQGLLDALYDWLDDTLAAEVTASTPTFRTGIEPQEIPASAEKLYHAFSRHERLMRALFVLTVALDSEPGRRAERSAAMRETLRRGFPHLDDDALEEAFTAVRLLVGSRTWYLARKEGVPDATAARAIRWAVDTLIADLAHRDAEAADA